MRAGLSLFAARGVFAFDVFVVGVVGQFCRLKATGVKKLGGRWRGGSGVGDWFALGCGRFEPEAFGRFEFGESFGGRAAEGGADGEVGDVGDVAFVVFAVENVDVVVLH